MAAAIGILCILLIVGHFCIADDVERLKNGELA